MGSTDDSAPSGPEGPERPSEDVLPTGTVVAGRYRVLSRVGSGSSTAVYRIRDDGTGDDLALKILDAEASRDGGTVGRFRSEVRLARKLHHPHVVPIYDFGEHRGRPFFTMAFVDGRTLRDALGELMAGPLERRLDILRQVGEGIDHANELVVHRDLRPENVLLRHDGVALVTGFGLAHALGGASMAGRPSPYVATELLVDFAAVDRRADVYALGVLLYELLTGSPPLPASPPPSRSPGVHPALDGVFRKAVAGEPAARYGSAAELQAAVVAALRPAPAPVLTAAQAPALPGPDPEIRPRRVPLLWVGIAGVCLGAGFGVGRWYRSSAASAPGVRSGESPAPPPNEPMGGTEAGRGIRTEVVGRAAVTWVAIPGGALRLGGGAGPPATVAPFEMARSEVTVTQYQACVRAGRCAEPATGPGCTWAAAGRGDHPVNCVSWTDAADFCAFAGGRLPTEAEWELAASRGGRSVYPWGNAEPTCERAVMAGSCGATGTAPVCSHPTGSTPPGVCDLAGNVQEWVRDRWTEPGDGSGPDKRVYRGGSWRNGPAMLRAGARAKIWPHLRTPGLGIRCVRTVPAATSPAPRP